MDDQRREIVFVAGVFEELEVRGPGILKPAGPRSGFNAELRAAEVTGLVVFHP